MDRTNSSALFGEGKLLIVVRLLQVIPKCLPVDFQKSGNVAKSTERRE